MRARIFQPDQIRNVVGLGPDEMLGAGVRTGSSPRCRSVDGLDILRRYAVAGPYSRSTASRPPRPMRRNMVSGSMSAILNAANKIYAPAGMAKILPPAGAGSGRINPRRHLWLRASACDTETYRFHCPRSGPARHLSACGPRRPYEPPL